MKKILILFMLSLLFAGNMFAVTVKVTSVFGKVKVKITPESKWSRVKVDDTLPVNALVSTGFNSELILDLGSSTLKVMPLTRMKIEKIAESSEDITTSLFLQGGKVKAEVDKVEDKTNNFKIKSPVATASVRGTSFEFTGNTLYVNEGVVAFGAPDISFFSTDIEDPEVTEESGQGETVAVQAGGESEMTGPDNKPVNPSVMAQDDITVSASTKPVVVKDGATETSSGIISDGGLSPGTIQSNIQSGFTTITIEIVGQ